MPTTLADPEFDRLLAVASDATLRKFRYGEGTMADPAAAHMPALDELERLAGADGDLCLADFEKVRHLGAGSFSSVELCRVRAREGARAASDDRLYAIKRIVAPRPCDMPAFDCVSLLAEGALLKRLRHPNVVACHGACAAVRGARGEEARTSALLLEHSPGGSLDARIAARDYDAPTALRWLLGVARGLAYLHNVDGVAIVHRDLKPSNVLLSADRRDAKLCDFGLYRIVPADVEGPLPSSAEPHALPPRPRALQSPVAARAAVRPRGPETPRSRAVARLSAHVDAIRLTARTGTICYMAPELWAMSGRYGAKVDLFSFGILAWEVLSQRRAYDEVAGKPDELIALIAERGLRPRLPAGWPAELRELLRSCWSADAAARPSAEQVVRELEAFIGAAGADGGRRHAQLALPGRRAASDRGAAGPACATVVKMASSSTTGSAPLRLRRRKSHADEHPMCCVIS